MTGGAALRIALVTEEPAGWHSTRLVAAFSKRGCETHVVSLRQCHFSTRCDTGWLIPGFEGTAPDGVFVRGIPGGTLDEVTFFLDVLHSMEHLGIPVYNDARTIERSVDKLMTSFLFKHAGVPTPDTCAVVDRERAMQTLAEATSAGRRLVVKPMFGSQGKGLLLAEPGQPLPDLPEVGTYYLQAFIETGDATFRDWRLFVIAGQVVAAMERISTHWVSNFARGAECCWTPIDAAMRTLAVAAVEAIDMAYAGVDLMRDAAGRLWVTEVNSIPAWKGLQGVTSIDIADILAADFLRRLRAGGSIGSR